MKNLIKQLFILSLVFNSCNSQTKYNNNEVEKVAKKEKNKDDVYEIAPVNFLDLKYKKDGFILPDETLTFPSYTFFDKNIGGFTVNYIGKTNLEQQYWEYKKSDGFFSKFDTDISIGDSKILNKKIVNFLKIKANNYFIVTDFLPKESIEKYYDDNSGEFELKDNAYRYFYLFENNQWIFLKKIKVKDINLEGILLYNDLVRSYKFKNLKSIDKKYKGDFSIYVKTEATTSGWASIEYNFSISANKVILDLSTYHEAVFSNGEYKAIENGNVLELYYFGDDDRYINISPNFRIKVEGNKYFIKGAGGEGTNGKWMPLKKK